LVFERLLNNVWQSFLYYICIFGKKVVILRGFMKIRGLILSILLFAWGQTWAYNFSYANEHESSWSVSYGGLWLQDQYLSPLLYSGQQIGIEKEWWKDFRRKSAWNWQQVGKVHLLGGMAYSELKNNLIYCGGVQGGWGSLYTWNIEKTGLNFLLGPYLNIDFMAKSHAVQVNKPYSIDIGIDACGIAGINWAFQIKNSSFRLRYLAQGNIVGVDYLPDYWQSYYEQTEGVMGEIRCSGMWNRRHLQHELTFDIQLKRSTWRIGVEHEYLEYGTKKMMFSRETVSAMVGCIFWVRGAR
jgi:hypothetical protein